MLNRLLLLVVALVALVALSTAAEPCTEKEERQMGCLNGECERNKGYLLCRCDPGYEGTRCETHSLEEMMTPQVEILTAKDTTWVGTILSIFASVILLCCYKTTNIDMTRAVNRKHPESKHV